VSEERELPNGWVWTTLGTAATINPRPNLQALPDDTVVSFVPMAAVEAGSGCLDPSEQRPLAAVRRGYTSFLEGDVVFAKITPCMENGKTAVARGLVGGIGLGSTEFHVLRPHDGVDAQFLYYYVSQEQFRQTARMHMTGTAGQLRVPTSFMAEAPFPLPSPPEQRRIVAAIEEQFTRLDAGVAALKSARARLKQYRAAVLKAAVEGELTKAWREAHPDTEPASELLARILAERRARWEGEQRAKDKDPAKGRYQEPVTTIIATAALSPRTWCIATVEQVSQIVRYGSSAKTSEDATGIAVLRMGNIQLGALDLTNLKYLPVNHTEFPDLLLAPGDLLFNRTNSPELVGKSAVYRGTPYPCSYASYLINVRLVEGCSPEYLAFFLNSSHGREWIASVVVQQVGQANVNGTKLQALAFALPPELEQLQIVEEVERRLSVLSALEKTVTAGLQRAERLRQSILTEAFSGRLVPQNERDEPASALLKRIQVGLTVLSTARQQKKAAAKPAQLPLPAND